jgi:DNA-binding winged helix-turn-helix (wHTH) protein
MTIDTQGPNGAVLAFGPYRLLPLQRIVLRDSTPLRIGSRAREILVALVERAGELVEKRELLKRVWPDVIVEEATLRVHINSLRKALREGEAGARYVESVTGRGYRFVAPVTPVRETMQTESVPLPSTKSQNNLTNGIEEGRPVLAFVHVDTTSLTGMQQLVALRELPEVEEIHSVTGESAMLLKVRARDTRELDSVLERMSVIEGFTATHSYIALSTYLERGPSASTERS